jgi:phosphopantothenoylcysteine decarboxylase/phosphopantothenate--cysteine ligase
LSPPENATVIAVESAKDMHKAVLKAFPKADVIIKTAAVADYRSAEPSKQKIKKTRPTLTLKLIKNPDILKDLGQRKKATQILVGFAAETEHLLKNAVKKIREKRLDWIVLNDVSRKDIGFSSDQNAALLIHKDGTKLSFKKMRKTELAMRLLKTILAS